MAFAQQPFDITDYNNQTYNNTNSDKQTKFDKLNKLILEQEPNYAPEYPHRDLIDLIKKLLIKSKSERLTDPQLIKKHPFFEGIDFEKLEKDS